MKDFSLELAADNIFNSKTKSYFQEVLSSYNSNNFRSAIVMLWSVVISDLVYKIQYIEAIFEDETSQNILDEISQIQKDNPNSPVWEEELVQMVNDRTSLLEKNDYQHLKNVQKLRHLCAHPAFDSNYELYTPDRDTTRACLRNMLEGVLVKSPLITKNIFIDFLQDMSDNKDMLTNNDTLHRYLDSKYFKHLSSDLMNNFFRSLWKLVFRTENKECNNNRLINYKSLLHLFSKREDKFEEIIKKEIDYYSNIDFYEYMIFFLSHYPKVYKLLNDTAKPIIDEKINSDFNLILISWFNKDNLKEHKNHVKKVFDKKTEEGFDSNNPRIDEKYFNHLWNTFISNGLKKEVIDLCVYFYGSSSCYNDANILFEVVIYPYINKFEKDDLKKLLKNIESNSQTYGRNRARYDHRLIKEHGSTP